MSDDTYGFEEDFQKLIVSSVLQDPQFLIQYDDVVQPGFFDFEYLGSIVRIARELTEKLEQVPSRATVIEEMKEYCSRFNIPSHDREVILTQLETLYRTEIKDIDYVRDKVVQFGQRQALRVAILKIIQIYNDKKKVHEDLYDEARAIMEQAIMVGVNVKNLGLSLFPNLDKIPAMASTSVAGISHKINTGFTTLDRNTMGGPGRGELWVVVGLPGRGKSAFLTNVGATCLKAGLPVAHITIGDLKIVDVGVRYAARLTMSSTYEVITGAESYMSKARMMMKYDPHLHIQYFPSDTATMGHVRAYLMKLRALHNVVPAVTIIDYPEELKMPVKNDLFLSGGMNYSAMSRMSAEFPTLIWTASQPTRWKPEHEADVICGINMGESWKKFQKVDGMVSWNMTNDEEMFGRGRIWVDKTRRHKSFYLIHCDVDLERMLIREGKPPEDPSKDKASYSPSTAY